MNWSSTPYQPSIPSGFQAEWQFISENQIIFRLHKIEQATSEYIIL